MTSLKRDDLAELVRDQKRFATQVKIRWATEVATLWIVSVGVIVSLIPADWRRWQRENLAFFWGIGAIAVLVVTGIVASRCIRRHAQRRGLFCTACNQLLTDSLGQTAVASSRCPRCGASIIDEAT